ncbi:MAG: DHH family phosphoesterase [Oscillospiraceae bacterium]|nr:DHH family phosphoesterase [Oscillospiraceae bacterium]
MNKKLGKLLRPGMGVYFFVMAAFCAVALLEGYYWLAAAETSVTMMIFTLYVLGRKERERQIQRYLQTASNTLEGTAQGESPLPAVLVRLADGGVVWANQRFSELTGYADTMMEQQLEEVLPGFSVDWLSSGKTEAPQDVMLGDRRYRIYGTILRAEDNQGTLLGVLYLSDLTELYQIRDEYIRSRPVVSIILIDNYEELTKNLTESAISTMNAKLNETITQWTEGYNGLLRKLERNRFLFIFEKRDLQQAVDEKFALLENIHEVTSPSGLPASISIGLGVDGANFEEGYNFAALSIEMALSRGGDQAVIKDRFNFNFYGGRNAEADYRSKVRSRVTANSLMELIGQSGHVFIMGHRNADLDSVGAAVGIFCLCRKKGRKANIVLDLESNSSQKLLEEILAEPEYRDAFISGQDALLQADNRSILIVVDTNRPDQVEFKPLLEAISKVCVVDHHRRAADYISPVVVNLHEPYASSASELVTEILLYAVEKDDVLPIEAKSLLAGICLDTKFFNVRTGERTFEAAAALRRMGADTTEVKKLLQNDFQDTMAKYQIIKSARLYRQEIAIAALNSGTTRVLAAQAADELLNISGITASFVMYPDEEHDQVIVSARSIGSANVQMILEPLGGGGNTATAGAQMKNIQVQDALDQLVESIDKYYEE